MRRERLQDIRLSKRKLLKGRLKSNVASMRKKSREKLMRNLKDRVCANGGDREKNWQG